jgi:hypothetical protein
MFILAVSQLELLYSKPFHIRACVQASLNVLVSSEHTRSPLEHFIVVYHHLKRSRAKTDWLPGSEPRIHPVPCTS